MDILLILLINIIAFAIPYIFIFIVSKHFANKNNIPFKTVLNFNDYVKNTIGGTTIFQIVVLIIDLLIFFYVGGNNDYSTTEVLIMVTCTNLMLFAPAASLTTLDSIREDMSNIKKTLPNKSIKF
jgi:hypothetical protein